MVKIIKIWSRRILMTILFVIAFLTTMLQVTGVEAAELHTIDVGGAKDFIQEHPMKKMSMRLKGLKAAFTPRTAISSSEEIKGEVPHWKRLLIGRNILALPSWPLDTRQVMNQRESVPVTRAMVLPIPV